MKNDAFDVEDGSGNSRSEVTQCLSGVIVRSDPLRLIVERNRPLNNPVSSGDGRRSDHPALILG